MSLFLDFYNYNWMTLGLANVVVTVGTVIRYYLVWKLHGLEFWGQGRRCVNVGNYAARRLRFR